MKSVEDYAEIIIRDDLAWIASENTIVYETQRIERLYKFHDGAIVKYEWQDSPRGEPSKFEIFNHRFTLLEPPSPNPRNFEKGVIKVIDFPW